MGNSQGWRSSAVLQVTNVDENIYHQFKAKFDAAKAEGDEALRNLSDVDPNVRYQAAKWIGRQARRETSNLIEFWLANKKATGALIKALRDEDERVVEEAAVAIHHTTIRYFADPRAYAALLPLLSSRRPMTRNSAVRAVALLGGEKSIPYVLPLLEDRVANVRLAAVSALHDVCNLLASEPKRKQICDAVLPRLRDKSVEVRDLAGNLLGSHGDASVLEELQAAMRRERAKGWKTALMESMTKLLARRK